MVGKDGCAWGPERPIYGKILYMSCDSTSRKFNSKAYIERAAAIEKTQGGELESPVRKDEMTR